MPTPNNWPTTGSGKTCTAIYRLLKQAKAKRALFPVDRCNHGSGAMREFNDYQVRERGLVDGD